MFIDKKTLLVAAVVLFILIVGGIYGYTAKDSKPHETISILNQSSEKSKEIKIYIIGEVVNPGTYAFTADARIEDAINAAGGALETADLASINLAAYIKDGQQIKVPSKLSSSSQESSGQQSGSTLININTADVDQLVLLPHIGPVTADNIIKYREQNGTFKALEDIMNVSRIGQKTFEAIKDLITVD